MPRPIGAGFSTKDGGKGRLPVAEGDAGFAEVVGGHLDVHFVADADADEVFSHFAGNVGQDFVAGGEGNTEHRPWQHLGDGSRNLDWLFFRHAEK